MVARRGSHRRIRNATAIQTQAERREEIIGGSLQKNPYFPENVIIPDDRIKLCALSRFLIFMAPTVWSRKF